MALTINTNIINDTDQYLLDAKNVKGGYIVVNSIAERDSLPAATTVIGSLCYCTADSKFYQYNGTAWAEKEFGTTVEATTSAAGLMSASDKQKLSGIAPGAEVNVQSDWNETNTSSDAFIKNKPTIPTVNNATLTIQKNGTLVNTFTANSATNVTANITVPTKTSELTNDSGFKTTDNNDNQTVKTGNVTFGVNDVVEFVAGSNVSISGDATNKKITISSTDTNTEATLAITDKTNTDTTDLVYAITNLVESGTKGHTLTPTYTGLPTKTYVDKMVTGTVEYLGTVSALTGLSTTAGKGDFYRVSTQFTFGSETAHVGDILLATKDNPTQAATDWDLIHAEVDSNTWVANSSTADGYVAKTNGAANKVWKTNASGVPSWQDDIDTDTHNSHAVISGKKADGTTDIKGSASAGDITLGDSGVTAGEYGPTSNQTPGYGATFNVPDIKVNAKGIVTSVTNRTVKIPASDNTDTGANSVEVTGTGNVVTAATYNASTRKLTLTKGATSVTTDMIKTEVEAQINTLISSGITDPSTDTTSQYYFKYN